MSRRLPIRRALPTVGWCGLAAAALLATSCGTGTAEALPPPPTVHIKPAAGAPAQSAAAGPVPTTTTAPTTTTSMPGSAHYEVQPGDTLYGVAAKFGTTVDVLTKLNPLKDVNRLLVGQDLLVPNPAATTTVPGSPAGGTAGQPATSTTGTAPVSEEEPEDTSEPTASTLPAATKDG